MSNLKKFNEFAMESTQTNQVDGGRKGAMRIPLGPSKKNFSKILGRAISILNNRYGKPQEVFYSYEKHHKNKNK